MGGGNHQCGVEVMEEEHGISRRGRLSDIDVCKKSGSITQSLYESHDGGEIFS